MNYPTAKHVITIATIVIAIWMLMLAVTTYRPAPRRMKLQRIAADARCIENYCENPQHSVTKPQCHECWADDFEYLLERLEDVFDAAAGK